MRFTDTLWVEYTSDDALIGAGLSGVVVGVRSVVLVFARRLLATAEQPALRVHLSSA